MEADRELSAMSKIAHELNDLEPDTIRRILAWVTNRYGKGGKEANSFVDEPLANNSSERQFPDVASFFDAVNPQSSTDRALTVAYWVQYHEDQSDFGSQEVNSKLKHLGHGIGNITDVFDSLMNQSPRLVIQKQKMGVSKQARKRYVVTAEGKKYIDRLVSPKSE